VFQDVREGIRRNVSVAYQIHDAEIVDTKDGIDTYRVTDWEPLEISIVAVPADASVSVGRSIEDPTTNTPARWAIMSPLLRRIMNATRECANHEGLRQALLHAYYLRGRRRNQDPQCKNWGSFSAFVYSHNNE
jgi:hypothetical protein